MNTAWSRERSIGARPRTVGGHVMKRTFRKLATASSLLLALCGTTTASAQKPGGVLKISFFDSPASMSLHEEATGAALRPAMGIFNNLVMYDQHVAQNRPGTIVGDLATAWSWNEEGTALTFSLRQGVKWHDGKSFTAADVKCTWDLLLGTTSDKLRVNPRKSWYRNLEQVTTKGDYEVTFHLKRPQPAMLALLASGWSPVYPCHVPTRDMRNNPIGTGPFKFAEFKPNEVMAQAPQAICELTSTNVSRNLILNRDKPPFDNADLRRAVALTLDRKAFIDIITQGKGDIGATLLPPEGLWGMPPEMLQTLPGYDPDVGKNRAAARKIMEKLGYGSSNRLGVTVSSRNIPAYRDPAVILIDQLKEIYIDGVLEPIETANWFLKVMRKDYTVGINGTESGVDDPDQQFYENFVCGAERNYTGYCNPEVDKLIDRQSAESDVNKRKQLVWQIERRLAQEGARPIIFYPRGGTCQQPYVKGLTTMVNSIYNGYRMEDVWLDR